MASIAFTLPSHYASSTRAARKAVASRKRRERMADVVRTPSLHAQCKASVAGARMAAVLARHG